MTYYIQPRVQTEIFKGFLVCPIFWLPNGHEIVSCSEDLVSQHKAELYSVRLLKRGC